TGGLAVLLLVHPDAGRPAVLAVAEHGIALVELLGLRAVVDYGVLGIGQAQVEVALDLLAPPRRLRPVIEPGRLFLLDRRVASRENQQSQNEQGFFHCVLRFHSSSLDSRISTMRAHISYTADTGEQLVNETFGPNNIRRRTSGTAELHEVVVSDGRDQALSLDRNGFELVEHRTAVKNFFDVDELKAVYYPEVEALIRARSGAARAVVFDHTLRSGSEQEREARLIREPVLSAHNDYTEWSGPQRVRELMGEEAGGLLARRFAIIQVWRAAYDNAADPILANPLALADARSVAFE